MGKHKNIITHMRTYITIGLACALFAALSGCGYYIYHLFYVVPPTQEQLETVLQARKDRVIDIVTSYQDAITSLTQRDDVQQYAQNVISGDSASSPKVIQNFTQSNKILIVAPDGTIAAAHPSSDVRGKNIVRDFPDTQIAASFQRSSVTTTPDISPYAIEPLSSQPTMYMTHPIRNEEGIIGFMVVDVSMNEITYALQTYRGLRTTGEFVVTRDAGTGAFTVLPTRHDPYAAFNQYYPYDQVQALPAQEAARGKAGSGITQDYRDTRVIAQWSFIPYVNWGIVTKIDYQEMAQPLWSWIHILGWLSFLLLGMLFVAAYMLYPAFAQYIRSLVYAVGKAFSMKIAVFSALVISLCGAAVTGISLYQSQKTRIQTEQQNLSYTARERAYYINQDIERVSTIADAISQDLSTGRLFMEDIPVRLRRVMRENPITQGVVVAFKPYAYDEKTRLHAPAVHQKNGTPEVTQYPYDYVDSQGTHQDQTAWYRRVVDASAQWLLPYDDTFTEQRVIPYAVPFRSPSSAEVIGVVTVLLDYNTIMEHIDKLQLGPQVYSFIMNKDSSLVYHPNEQYITSHVSLYDIAKERKNDSFARVVQQMQQADSGVEKYYDSLTDESMWCVYTNIDAPQWTVAITFPHSSAHIPQMQAYRYYLWIFVWIVLLGVSTILWALYTPPVSMQRARWASGLVTIFLSISLLFFWYMFSRFSIQRTPPDAVVVENAEQNNMFIQSWKRGLEVRNMSVPQTVPIGIFVNAIDVVSSEFIEVTGELWYTIPNSYSHNHPENVPLVYFPRAQESEFEHLQTTKDDSDTTMKWKFVVKQGTQHNYTYFPFDTHYIALPFISRMADERIMLVPYFASYTHNETMRGIDKNLNISGFTLRSTKFVYVPHRKQAAWSDGEGRTVDTMQLRYTVTLARRLTNSFIVFFIPLLVVLVTLFIRFLITRAKAEETPEDENIDVYGSMRTYLAVFFSLIILHQTLRNRYQTGKFLYIEYLFFFSYVAIVILLLHALLLRISKTFRTCVSPYMPIMSLYFWPVNLVLWLLTTVYVFY